MGFKDKRKVFNFFGKVKVASCENGKKEYNEMVNLNVKCKNELQKQVESTS